MRSLFFVLYYLSSLHTVNGQPAISFKQLRYEEDYSGLINDTTRNWYTSSKYISLSENKTAWLSLGGDIRFQYLRFSNENWGGSSPDNDGFLLTRYLVHADLHSGKHFRTFVQLQSSLANGKTNPPSPVDENQLDLHQAFADWRFFHQSAATLTLRLGRQELLYGSQRLIAVRDGPNNRQSFDAGRMIFTNRQWTGDLFFSHAVPSKQKIFDDGFNKHVRLWGAYLVRKDLPVISNIDLYYFGLRKTSAVFDDGKGRELRHSIGTRIWHTLPQWRYDIEALYQFGNFADKKISAWTASVNAGYRFTSWRLKPEAGIKAELISGDAMQGDSKLGTFNPLFPRGGYFGLVSLIGPANLCDIHPSLLMELTPQIILNMDCDIFWRYSAQDGIYQPNVALIYSGTAGNSTSIGRQYSADLVYTPNGFLYFRGECSYFKAGGFLKEAGPGKNILFVAGTIQLRF